MITCELDGGPPGVRPVMRYWLWCVRGELQRGAVSQDQPAELKWRKLQSVDAEADLQSVCSGSSSSVSRRCVRLPCGEKVQTKYPWAAR